jgi:polyisoprenoid-binding protein YceI
MKHISIILLAWMTIFQAGQELYVCKNASLSLYSSAPIEDIEASTSKGVSVLNISTGELSFSVAIASFKFGKSLMQEHFNSDYMESDKYPRAAFKGKIAEKIDVSKDGTYPINVTGNLTVHNVTAQRTIPGTLVVKGGMISMKSEFKVKCVDYHIEIPKIVFHNIAETIKINVVAAYMPYK